MPDPKTAVLLMAHGGPETIEDVEPFLAHIMKGRTPTPELVTEIRDRYRQIGERSPIRTVTEQQAAALEKAVRARPKAVPANGPLGVYVGMRHWHPFIHDTVKQIARDKVQRLVALSLAPHYSAMSVGAYFAALESACKEVSAPPEVIPIRSYASDPLLLKAIAERVFEALALMAGETSDTLRVLFTAHSLPEKILQENDPYPRELQATVDGVAKLLLERRPGLRWEFGYQSRGRIPGPWLGPEVDAVIPRLAGEGCRTLLVVPVGFVSDHIEILYDIDILYKKLAEESGIRLFRTASLNDHPTFIAALADQVFRAIGQGHA